MSRHPNGRRQQSLEGHTEFPNRSPLGSGSQARTRRSILYKSLVSSGLANIISALEQRYSLAVLTVKITSKTTEHLMSHVDLT